MTSTRTVFQDSVVLIDVGTDDVITDVIIDVGTKVVAVLEDVTKEVGVVGCAEVGVGVGLGGRTAKIE